MQKKQENILNFSARTRKARLHVSASTVTRRLIHHLTDRGHLTSSHLTGASRDPHGGGRCVRAGPADDQ